jgi:aquaporin TIP
MRPAYLDRAGAPSDARSSLTRVFQDALSRAAAEFVGTFALVFIAAGSVIVMAAQGTTLVGVALAYGLAVAVMVSAVGHISGGHFNPAITFGFLITGRMAPILSALYLVAQLAAAASAALLLKWIYADEATDAARLGAPALADQVEPAAGLIVEVVLTFFLVWVVFATAADPRGTFKSIAGLAIGLTITADVLMGGPLTGAAMNPARAFGPQLVGNEWGEFWIWYIGPLLGGGLAALAYDLLDLRPLAPVPVGPAETGLDEPRPGDTAAS